MPRGDGARGTIAIVEMVLGELNDPGLGALIDMNMLAASPGQERSLDEYDALLAAAGLRRTAVLATSSPQSIIVAVVAPADHGPATTCPSKSIVGLG